MTAPTSGPGYYVTGAVWTTPNGPDDGGACIAQRANTAPSRDAAERIHACEKDANLRLCAAAPDMLAALQRLQNMTNRDDFDALSVIEGAIAKAGG